MANIFPGLVSVNETRNRVSPGDALFKTTRSTISTRNIANVILTLSPLINYQAIHINGVATIQDYVRLYNNRNCETCDSV